MMAFNWVFKNLVIKVFFILLECKDNHHSIQKQTARLLIFILFALCFFLTAYV